MGFVDKLKNIFFEEEEEEEEYEERVPARKEKEEIAKKVEIPKKRQQAKEIEEMMEQNKQEVVELAMPKKEEPKKSIPKINTDLIFDDDDFVEQKPVVKKEVQPRETPKPIISSYKTREREFSKTEVKETKYEYPKTTYVKKEEPKGFTPSPIISPIYGILDKNYKKEEVKEKKEIRISSRPVKMDLDSVRNKAFGDLEYDLLANAKDDFEEEVVVKEKKVYDTSKEDKPLIDRVTLGEADEYFQDLGLAYNTDYKDLSKDINDGKIKEKKETDHLEDNLFDLIDSMYDKEE